MLTLKWLYNTGLLVTNRDIFRRDRRLPRSRERLPAIDGTEDEVLRKYRGFDGRPWPDRDALEAYRITLTDGLASFDQYDKVLAYYADMSKQHELVYLLALGFPGVENPHPLLSNQFFFAGYDYGYYLAEYSVFSSIFNEMIFGYYEELRNFAKELNNYLLAPSLDLVKSIHDVRTKMLNTAGTDLERGGPDEFGPIAVYLPTTT